MLLRALSVHVSAGPSPHRANEVGFLQSGPSPAELPRGSPASSPSVCGPASDGSRWPAGGTRRVDAGSGDQVLSHLRGPSPAQTSLRPRTWGGRRGAEGERVACGSTVYLPEGLPGSGAKQGHGRGSGSRAERQHQWGPGPRRLTVNESEGSQEHDPGQPEGARTKVSRGARGITLRPGQRPTPRAPISRLPPPQLLHRHRHCRAVRAHARGAPRAGTPHPHRENTPFSCDPAHTWGYAHLRGSAPQA